MPNRISRPNIVFLLPLALTLYLFAAPVRQAHKQNSSGQESKVKIQPVSSHLILITISGLRSDFITSAESYRLRIPTIQSLRTKGSYAVGTESVFPSQTIPAHATMITGTLPADHGITSDYAFNEKDAIQLEEPYKSAKEIKTDTICQAARRMNLITAAVGFPLTAGAAINFNLPDDVEDVKVEKEGSLDQPTRAQSSTPPELRNEILSALKDESDRKLLDESKKFPNFAKDSFKASAAAYLIEKHHPNLLLINFTSFDDVQRRYGLLSAESLRSLELIDGLVKKIVDATERSRIAEKTTFIVISDHGAAKVEKEFNPNVLLAKKGWLTSDSQGRIISWRAVAQSFGGAAAIFVRDPQDEDFVREVEAFFDQQAEKPDSPIWRVIPKRDATKLGADPRVALYLDAAPSHAISAKTTGSSVTGAAFRTAHGYAPSRAEMRAAFIIAGNGIKSGSKLEYARLIDIAPTIARLLGLEMKTARGRVIAEVIK
ncbi:MAG: alkaline phosphatase family protein [Blastocatellales bacterium]